MKRFVFLTLSALVLVSGSAQAETYIIDAAHSTLEFSIRHLVSKTKGTFSAFSGTITYDAAHSSRSAFAGTVEVASLDTRNKRRNVHLLSADFFDVATYPTITFTSTASHEQGDELSVTGKLTLHGVTKQVSIPVEILGTGTNPMSGKQQIGLTGTLTILASDYGLNRWENFTAVLGDEVEIGIFIEANTK